MPAETVVGPLKVLEPPRINVPGPPLVKPTGVPPLSVIGELIVKGAELSPCRTTTSASELEAVVPEDGSQRPAADDDIVGAHRGRHEDPAAGQRQPAAKLRLPAGVVLNRRLLTVAPEGVNARLVTSTLLPAA